MTKLKIESVLDEKPVKVTVELPADVDRDLKAWDNTDDNHKQYAEHRSPQKSGNYSSVMRCQSPYYPTKCSRRLCNHGHRGVHASSGPVRHRPLTCHPEFGS